MMAGESTLGVKLRLELEEPTPTLLYFPYAEPAAEDDWLLDIKLYSGRFYADRVRRNSMSWALRAMCCASMSQRQAFLASRKRIEALKRLVTPSLSEDELDLAMLAVVVGATSLDVATLLFHLAEEAVTHELGLETNPPALVEAEKYALVPAFVRALQAEVGYPASREELSGETPLNFGQLMLWLLITGYCESISDIPDWARQVAIPSVNARASSRALLTRWRDSSRFYPAFDVISGWVADAQRIDDKLHNVPLEQLSNVATFEVVEKQIIVDLCQAIPTADVRDLRLFDSIIVERLDGYWAFGIKMTPAASAIGSSMPRLPRLLRCLACVINMPKAFITRV